MGFNGFHCFFQIYVWLYFQIYIYDKNRKRSCKSIQTKDLLTLYRWYYLQIRLLKDKPDQLIEQLNSNLVNMNFTVEVCPVKFLDTKVIYKSNHIPTKVYHKKSYQFINYHKFLSSIKRTLSLVIWTEQHVSPQEIKPNFLNADYPLRFISKVINNLVKNLVKWKAYDCLFEIP